MSKLKGRRITIEEARRGALATMELVERLKAEERERDSRAGEDERDREIAQLKELVRHCWVHSAYSDCGFREMEGEMRDLYCEVIGRPDSERWDKT